MEKFILSTEKIVILKELKQIAPKNINEIIDRILSELKYSDVDAIIVNSFYEKSKGKEIIFIEPLERHYLQTKSKKLYLRIKRKEFDRIKSGEKKKEYRCHNQFNTPKLINSEKEMYFKYNSIIFMCGTDTIEIEHIQTQWTKFINEIPEGFKKGDMAYVIYLGKIIN